jgi:hypothetical protein
MYAFRYFFRYELPKIEWLAKRLTDGDAFTGEMKDFLFTD